MIIKFMLAFLESPRFFVVVKWTAIIGLSLALYYWAQPFLEKSLGFINEATGTMDQFRQTENLLKQNIAPANDVLQKAQDILKQTPKK